MFTRRTTSVRITVQDWRSAMLSTDHFRYHLLFTAILMATCDRRMPTFTTSSRSLCAQAPFPPCPTTRPHKPTNVPKSKQSQHVRHTTMCDLCIGLIGSPVFSLDHQLASSQWCAHVLLLKGSAAGGCGGLLCAFSCLLCAFSCLLCESVERRSLSCPEQSWRHGCRQLGTFKPVQDLHMYSFRR